MLDYAATVFVTFLVVFDPIGILPLFIVLTQHQTKEQRRATAIRSVTIAGATLMVLAFAGDALLRFLGVGFPAFRVAGGILLFLLSIDMVFARQSGLRSATEAETQEAASSTDVAVFPLAIPLIAGPGAITSLLLLLGKANGNIALQAIVIALMLLVLALCLATFLLAAPLVERLGLTGINVVGRVFGIIVAALAVQYVVDGIADIAAALAARSPS